MAHPTTPPASVDPAVWWALDSYRQGGHTVSEALQFMSYLDDEQTEQARLQRRAPVNAATGFELGPRRGRGLLGWLLDR